MQQLKCWLTVNLPAANAIGDVDLLDLVAERVQQLGEVDRFGSLGSLARSTARLVMHRLR